jgi:L-cysteine S-thiosulfotransferase
MASAKQNMGGKRAIRVSPWLWLALVAGAVGLTAMAARPQPGAILDFIVVGDGIPAALTAAKGDAARGRALIVARDAANCVLCHAVTDPAVRYSGNIGPSLDGVAHRLSVAQLRLRVADSTRIDPGSIMPAYYRTENLDRVAGVYVGRPILEAGQVEDIVAYLATLQ